MKYKPLLFVFAFLCPAAAFAQFPEAGNKSFTFGLNGLTNIGLNTNIGHTGSLLFKYYKTDDMAFRYSLNISANSGSNINLTIGRSITNSNSSFSAAPGFGIQKSISKFDKFNIYAGADLAPYYKVTSTEIYTEVTDSTQVGGKNGDYTDKINRVSIFGINLYPFIGFEYFLSKHFSIGGEFNVTCSYNFPANSYAVTDTRTDGIDYKGTPSNTPSKSSFTLSTATPAAITCSLYF